MSYAIPGGLALRLVLLALEETIVALHQGVLAKAVSLEVGMASNL